MRDGKLHVLFIVSRCPVCGTVNVLRDILRHCSDHEFSFSLITTLPEYPDNSVLTEFTARMEHIFVPMSVAKGLLGMWEDVKRAIDNLSPDVIHSTWIVPDRLVSRLYPEKQLMILHSDFLPDYTYSYGLFPGLFLTWLHLRAVRRAKAAIAVSESLAGIFRKKYRITAPFIQNGITVSDPSPRNKQALRKILGLPENRKVFVCGATLCRRKDQRFLINAFLKAPENGPLLLLLGDGPDEGRLRKSARGSENIRLTGFVFNMADSLAAADYYVSASRSEGLPLSVLEAMGRGLPPLLSDIPQHREIVSLTNGYGECFALHDEASFLDALHRLMEKDYEKAQECCRESVRRYFSAEAMSYAYQEHYRRIGAKGGDHDGS